MMSKYCRRNILELNNKQKKNRVKLEEGRRNIVRHFTITTPRLYLSVQGQYEQWLAQWKDTLPPVKWPPLVWHWLNHEVENSVYPFPPNHNKWICYSLFPFGQKRLLSQLYRSVSVVMTVHIVIVIVLNAVVVVRLVIWMVCLWENPFISGYLRWWWWAWFDRFNSIMTNYGLSFCLMLFLHYFLLYVSHWICLPLLCHCCSSFFCNYLTYYCNNFYYSISIKQYAHNSELIAFKDYNNLHKISN